jgi:hypothetical protein
MIVNEGRPPLVGIMLEKRDIDIKLKGLVSAIARVPSQCSYDG